MAGLPGAEVGDPRARRPSRHDSRRRMRAGGVRGMRSRDPALPRLRGVSRRCGRDHRKHRGERPGGRRQSHRRHPVPPRPVPHRRHPVYRAVVAGAHGRHGPLHHRGRGVPLQERSAGTGALARRPADPAGAGAGAGAGSRPGPGGEHSQVPPQAAACRARGREGRAGRAGGAGEARAAVRAGLRLRGVAAARPPRRAEEEAQDRLRRGPGGGLAPGRDETRGFRHRGRGGRGASGPRGHPLRAATGPGAEGEPRDEPRQGPRPLAVHGERAHRGGHPRQDHHRTGDPQPGTRDRRAERRAQVQPVRQRCFPSCAGSRQGHLGTAGGRESGEDAPSPGGGDHRIGQVRRRQRDDPEPALQGVRLRRAG